MQIALSLLKNALNRAAVVMDSNPIIPALGNILLSFTEKEMVVKSSKGGRVSLEQRYEGNFSPCELLLPMNIVGYLNSLPEQPISLKVNKKSVNIRHSKGKHSFPLEGSKDFIVFPEAGENEVTLDAQELKDGVLSCQSFSNKKENLLTQFHCVCIGPHFIGAATGGEKCAKMEIPYEGKFEAMSVSNEGIKAFELMPDSGMVSSYQGDRHICFEWEGNRLFMAKQENPFPVDAFLDIMRSEYVKGVEVDAEEIKGCLRRIKAVLDPLSEGSVKLYTEGGSLMMTNGTAFEAIKCEGELKLAVVKIGDLISAVVKMVGDVEIGQIGDMGTMLKNDNFEVVLTNLYNVEQKIESAKKEFG